MHTGRIFIGALFFAVIITRQLFAQSVKHNNKKKPASDSASLKADQSIVILFPDFFQFGLVKKGDTSFAYEYYNRDMEKLNLYELKNIDEVDHVKYFKGYSSYTVKPNSVISAPIEYILQYEYIHPGSSIWTRHDVIAGTITKYKLHKDVIVGAENVTLTEPVTKNQRKFIYKYYKTEVISTTNILNHTHEH